MFVCLSVSLCAFCICEHVFKSYIRSFEIKLTGYWRKSLIFGQLLCLSVSLCVCLCFYIFLYVRLCAFFVFVSKFLHKKLWHLNKSKLGHVLMESVPVSSECACNCVCLCVFTVSFLGSVCLYLLSSCLFLISLSVCLYVGLSVCLYLLSSCLYLIRLSVCSYDCLFVCLFVSTIFMLVFNKFVGVFICWFVCLFVYTSYT